MSIERRYAETLHANFPSYFANFPPNREVRLGQFGSLVDGMFNPIGSVESTFGLKLPGVRTSAEGASFRFTSRRGVKVALRSASSAKIVGQPDVSAVASIGFDRGGAVFFAAADCKVENFDDELPIRNAIVALFAEKKWQANWTLVTGRVTAQALNLVVSGADSAFIDLEAHGVQSIDFADAAIAGSLKTRSSESIGHEFVACRSTVPFLQLVRIRRRFRLFGSTSVHIERLVEERAADVEAERIHLEQLGTPLDNEFEAVQIEGEDRYGF